MAEIIITKENFKDEVANVKDMPILLDFWADWCGPCNMLSPIVEEVSNELDGQVRVGKVNVDEQPELATAFGVESIPLLVVMKNGVVVNHSVGYCNKEKILKMLEI